MARGMDSLRRHILELSRRGVLRGATGLAALAALQPASSRGLLAQPVFSRYPFSLGVASGDLEAGRPKVTPA